MTSTAVVLGAGAVGRGFIAEVFTDAGWRVTFVEADPELVDALSSGPYPHDTVSTAGTSRKLVHGCTAVLAQDVESVAHAVAEGGVVFTCVGARNLSRIAPALAQGLARRDWERLGPVDIFLAENVHDGPTLLGNHLTEALREISDDASNIMARVGLVSTSIGRMIPVPREEQRQEHVALVAVEPYRELPFDVSACRAPVPDVPDLVSDASVDFDFFTSRKLYVHNLGHCVVAHLGQLGGYTEIAEAISHPVIHRRVRAVMMTSAMALAARHEKPVAELTEHVDGLIERFHNVGLHDTVERVGRDPERKLQPGERFMGALDLAAAWGDATPLAEAIALALHVRVSSPPSNGDGLADVERVRADVYGHDSHLGELFDHAWTVLRDGRGGEFLQEDSLTAPPN